VAVKAISQPQESSLTARETLRNDACRRDRMWYAMRTVFKIDMSGLYTVLL